MSKELKKNNCSKKITKKESQVKLFNFLVPKVNVQLNKKIILDACIDLVTVNGRPFSMLNDTGFRKILDPVLNGFQEKKFTVNSYSIKYEY